MVYSMRVSALVGTEGDASMDAALDGLGMERVAVSPQRCELPVSNAEIDTFWALVEDEPLGTVVETSQVEPRLTWLERMAAS